MKKKEDVNAYMNSYMKERYKERKTEALALLGGICVNCKTKENLHFDHIDPDKKEFTITTRLASAPWEDIEEELKKCQLLCEHCHQEKTLEDMGFVDAKITHGTISSYRYCKCNECKQAKRDYMAKYRRRER